jgi:PleD family two-component response regulator
MEVPAAPSLLISDKTLLGCELLARSLAGHAGHIAQATSSTQVLDVAQQSNPEVALISAALRLCLFCKACYRSVRSS